MYCKPTDYAKTRFTAMLHGGERFPYCMAACRPKAVQSKHSAGARRGYCLKTLRSLAKCTSTLRILRKDKPIPRFLVKACHDDKLKICNRALRRKRRWFSKQPFRDIISLRRLAAVRYYLTRLLLIVSKTGLSSTAWQQQIDCFYGNQTKSITEKKSHNLAQCYCTA